MEGAESAVLVIKSEGPMRNFKIVGGMLLIFLAMLVFIAADRYVLRDDARSDLTVSAAGEELPLYACEPGSYQKAFRDYAWRETLRYVPLGTTVRLQFEKDFPVSVKVSDFILNQNGELRYSERSTQIFYADLLTEEKSAQFPLPVNPAAMLSSNSESYEPGNSTRGFFVSCVFDNGPQEAYVFLLRTDADG